MKISSLPVLEPSQARSRLHFPTFTRPLEGKNPNSGEGVPLEPLLPNRLECPMNAVVLHLLELRFVHRFEVGHDVLLR